MPQREVEIVNKLGLHARASAKLTQLAAKYQRDVWLSRNGRRGEREEHHGRDDARRRQGQPVALETDGADEDEALEAVVALIDDNFGEGE